MQQLIAYGQRFAAEYIQPCRRNDPKIDACFYGTLTHIQPYLVKGEYKMPVIHHEHIAS
jgi:hypothetical protein